jgi:ABC-type transport system involved in multi-copper enzyme maturation permease subunit
VKVGSAAIFGLMVWVFYLRFAVPVLAVFYGTSLMADEVEDKTITYLFTRPIPRSAVLVGKYLAYLASTVLIVLPSVMLVFFLVVPIGGGGVAQAFPTLLRDLLLLATGLAVYGALFAAVGAWIKRPVLFGLFFAFGWENVAMLLPGYLKRFTVAFYTQSLVPHAMPQDSLLTILQSVFKESVSGPQAVLTLLAVLGLALALATRAVERREYVLEQ